MRVKIGSSFEPLLANTDRYLLLCGGGGSGKSEFIGRKIFYRCQVEGNHKFLILRKVRATCKESVITLMLAVLKENEVKYTFNKTDRVIEFNSSQIIFDGLDDPEKIKSIKGITGIWLEEFTEFTRQDFIQLDLRLRGETKHYKQIIASFNPDEAQGAWIKSMFFDNRKAGSTVHTSTVDDNPFIDEEYKAMLDSIDDPTYHKIYRLGLWALAKGIIYQFPNNGDYPDDYDEIIYGLDFGYNNPSALIQVGIKDNEFYLMERLFQTKLTNTDLIERLKDMDIDEDTPIYADSSEPDRIEEICQSGLNALPAWKGKQSVKDGIDYVKSCKLHTNNNNSNLNEEFKSYKWEERKDGELSDHKPVKFKDHGMDALRYAMYTRFKERGQKIEIRGLY